MLAPTLPAPGPATTSVRATYPVDARPPWQLRDAPYFFGQVPLGQLVYGDASLRPGALDAVWIDLELGTAAHGVALDAQAPVVVRTWVLEHAGVRDVSDAQWVSTVSGGLTGLVGKAFYPTTFTARARLRVAVHDANGELLALRDASAWHVSRTPTAATWGFWYVFGRSLVARRFEEAFADVHAELASELGAIVAQAAAGEPVTAGHPPDAVAYPSFAPRTPDSASLGIHGLDPATAARYRQERFSVISGHDTARGEVIGHLGAPLDTLGYEIGVHDDVQVGVGLTLIAMAPYVEAWVPLVSVGETFGLYDALTLSVRGQLVCWRASCVSLDAVGGVDSLVTLGNPAHASFGATRLGLGAQYSVRPDEATWLLHLGATRVDGLHRLASVGEAGNVTFILLSGGPGVEVQITPTTALALEIRTSATLVSEDGPGTPLSAALTPPLPQLTVGFR